MNADSYLIKFKSTLEYCSKRAEITELKTICLANDDQPKSHHPACTYQSHHPYTIDPYTHARILEQLFGPAKLSPGEQTS